MTGKQAAALAGLAPFADDSGKVVGERHIHGGRSAVRCTLYMCALTAVRYEGKIKTFYESLLKAGKCKMKALTACMRKMLVIINARVRDAILALQADPQARAAMAERGRHVAVERYSLEAIVDRYDCLLRTVAAGVKTR